MATEFTVAKHYLVGGGISSLAAAVMLLRDADVSGENVVIYEQLSVPGGSLDGSGGPEEGYLVRGGRMFEKNFVCTTNLLSSIPDLEVPERSVWEDILEFNKEIPGSSNCRLVRDGQKADMALGLGPHDILNLNELLLTPERRLENRTIDDWFNEGFFETNFWMMWSTMFSFQPWHSLIEMRRYQRRFLHLLPGFSRIKGILRTRYNQYDSIIAPIESWLKERGVRFETGREVLDLDIRDVDGKRQVAALFLDGNEEVEVRPTDRVYVTLGSMTDASTRGGNTTVPAVPAEEGASWRLWRRLAGRFDDLGTPEPFVRHVEATTWMSFTATMDRPDFFDHMETFTGNRTGTGGLVTIADSGWTMSVVMFRQPHFRDQAEGRFVFWGYGLRGDREGDFVKKPMWACTGDEIIQELIGQLRLTGGVKDALEGAKVVTARMPHITSHFMPRQMGDRPLVRPEGALNFAFMGQYCEIPLDTVFTVEYSVRSAMQAVHEMTGWTAPPPPVVRSDQQPRVLLRAAKVLMGL